MGDLTRTQQAVPVQITDDSSQLAALSTGPVGTEVGVVTRNIPYGTQAVSGTVTIGGTTVTQPVSGTVTSIPSGTNTVTGTVTAVQSGTYTIANSTVSVPNIINQITVSYASTTQILASNTNRKMAIIFNGGVNNVYIKFGSAASSTSFTLILQANGLYEMPIPVYTGVVHGLASTSNTILNVTEL